MDVVLGIDYQKSQCEKAHDAKMRWWSIAFGGGFIVSFSIVVFLELIPRNQFLGGGCGGALTIFCIWVFAIFLIKEILCYKSYREYLNWYLNEWLSTTGSHAPVLSYRVFRSDGNKDADWGSLTWEEQARILQKTYLSLRETYGARLDLLDTSKLQLNYYERKVLSAFIEVGYGPAEEYWPFINFNHETAVGGLNPKTNQ
jgi:hypothetical protein